ncbi:hypothetical protein [Pyxidicoccus sp. MSG2]|uniref:hypothetical protein n=1 Tax=Pyxidicoccus sp. MSG2 TaxID=2996790 RepID=UPI00226FAEA1|nr:hypothetical protein [Pyxidicoccus sp. MSG2]MCY1021718.1 hypothetical protein [Pyxidicoccus sp. MSG2]
MNRLETPITDWSKAGCASLVQEHREVLALLLRHSLAQVAKPYGEQNLLDAFRFRTLDDAVDWCLERFATGTLKPGKLGPPSRSWRLFTQARFWLSQREGAAGFQRKMQQLEAACRRDLAPAEPPESEVAPAPDLDVQRLVERLSHTLSELLARTCPDLVTWWLRATEELRSLWFELPIPEPAHEPRMKKERSIRIHDALFRFACLFCRLLLHEKDAVPSHLAVAEWLFRRCQNVPPYRRTEEEIAAALPLSAPKEKRAIQRLRREGVSALIHQLISSLDVPTETADAVALMEWQLLRMSVTKTTLTAFALDEGASPELERRIEALPSVASRRRP